MKLLYGPDAMPEVFSLTRYQSPLGAYVIVSSECGIVCIEPETSAATHFAQWERKGIQIRDGNDHNQKVAAELDAYFAGNLQQFSVSLDLRGTDFQHQVWELLLDIPYGQTRSYGQVAAALGCPSCSRAVGRAIGTNPVSIILPCHRVIGTNGALVGYGGGLDRKRVLLDLEARVIRQKHSAQP